MSDRKQNRRLVSTSQILYKVNDPLIRCYRIFSGIPLDCSTAMSNPICNSYTMVCPPVRRDNSRALVSNLSLYRRTVHGINIIYHAHQ